MRVKHYNRSTKSPLEIEAHQFMLEHGVLQTEIADAENVGNSAINQRLKRLNPAKLKAFKGLVIKVKNLKERQLKKAG